MLFENVMIVGTGLIGASLGLALKDSQEVNKIIGYDNNIHSLQNALEISSFDLIGSISDLSKANLIIFATPVETTKKLLLENLKSINENTVVTDVGSTKEEIMNLFDSLNGGINFIGGHPLAGSEKSGPLNAKKDLFKNKPYILVRSKNCKQESFEKFKTLILKIGATPIILDAKIHDKILAVTSHLPQIVAFYLMKTLMDLNEIDNTYLNLTGSGFKDTTRLAGSDAKMWIDIFKQNKNNIIESLTIFEKELKKFKRKLANDKYEKIKEELESIRSFKTRSEGKEWK